MAASRLLERVEPAREVEATHRGRGAAQHGVDRVRIGIQFVAYEKVVRIMPADGIGGVLVIAVDNSQEKLDIVTSFIGIG